MQHCHGIYIVYVDATHAKERRWILSSMGVSEADYSRGLCAEKEGINGHSSEAVQRDTLVVTRFRQRDCHVPFLESVGMASRLDGERPNLETHYGVEQHMLWRGLTRTTKWRHPFNGNPRVASLWHISGTMTI